MKRRISLFSLLAAFALVVTACGGSDTADETTAAPSATTTTAAPMPTTVVDLAVEAGQFSTLTAAVEAAGLVETLESEGPFTVLAPTDEAFDAAFDALGITAEELLSDVETLTAILTYHVIPQAADQELVATLDGQSVPTVNGQSVAISVTNDQIMIDQATVVSADLKADNGIVHVIDSVLLPPDVAVALGVDAAPVEDTTTTTEAMTEPTIVQIVSDLAAGDPAEFSILLAAVQAADPTVAELLSNADASVTVFAPTDAAFGDALAALEITAEDLLASQELLTAILLYHVVDGAVFAEDVIGLDGQSVETLNAGQSVSITITAEGAVRLNDGVAPLGGSTVAQVDVTAGNGVIHIIDTVLVNPEILGS